MFAFTNILIQESKMTYFYLTDCRLTYSLCSLPVKAASSWNELPTDLKHCMSVNIFKSRLFMTVTLNVLITDVRSDF
jgi:hypothetical protein